ncbi:MAG: radical SAM protein [Candidatus Thorarchaeota archaeon]
MALAYPFLYHPCWTMNRTTLWERIHLPIAKKCNLRCNYCDTLSNTCHSIGPGSSVRSFTVDEAWEILTRELSKRRNLHIVGISGPGEPLHNHETFEFLEKLSRFRPSMKVCISTNGILLSNSVETLADLGVDSLSISINAASPETASKLYGVPSIERSAEVIRNQLDGIQKAREFCIPVKVNTILVPGVNS